MAKKYYNIKTVQSIGAEYNILLSERSNGKSYACKRLIIDEALKNPGKIVGILLRRAVQEIKQSTIKDYFLDLTDYLDKKSKGEYNAFTYWQGDFYIGHYDEHYKIIKDFAFCKACHLYNAQLYKSSLVTPDCKHIIFEEFMNQDSNYILDEPKKLIEFVSTVFRHNTGQVWLLANKVSRVCPYTVDWGLRNLSKIQPGTIDQYHYKREVDNEEVTTTIAVEHCPVLTETAKSTMFFGKQSESITGGVWETREHPHLVGKLNDYDVLYQLSLESTGFQFNILLLVHKEEGYLCVYVYPSTLKTFDRLITETYSTDPLKTPGLRKDIRPEPIMRDLYNNNKWVYPNNLLAEDFIGCINNMAVFPLTLL